jgi:signal transduction histidine kinase
MIGFALYGIMTYFISNDHNEKLYNRKEYVLKQLLKSDSLLKYQHLSGNNVSIKEIPTGPLRREKITDTLIFDNIENKFFAYRQLAFSKMVNHHHYFIEVRKSLTEVQSIVKGTIIIMFLIVIIVFGVTFYLNEWIAKQIWQPVYLILNKMKNLPVKKLDRIILPETNVQEFNDMIHLMNQMIDQMKEDFNNLKNFVENTSHEVQTPLAVIKSKLELLLQSENFNPEQYKLVDTCYQSVHSLSKLSEALGLLSKIENGQFADEETVVDLNKLIDFKLGNYEELIKIKEIQIKKVVLTPIKLIRMNSTLADILIENIINNAIKHNYHGGEIAIEVNNDRIRFINTGNVLTSIPTSLFERFRKENSKSLGLGLSIVREITNKSNMGIAYHYEHQSHEISLTIK